MPYMCFGYPPGIGNRGVVYRPATGCFDYPADVPTDGEIPDAARLTPPGLRRMPLGSGCFRYPGDVPPGNGNRDGAQSTSPEVRSMPYPCFRY